MQSYECKLKSSVFRVGSSALHGLVLILIMARFTPGFSQTIFPIQYREWEATGFVGTSVSGTLKFPTPVSGSSQQLSRTVEMHYQPGFQVGVRASQYFYDFWSADLEYSF